MKIGFAAKTATGILSPTGGEPQARYPPPAKTATASWIPAASAAANVSPPFRVHRGTHQAPAPANSAIPHCGRIGNHSIGISCGLSARESPPHTNPGKNGNTSPFLRVLRVPRVEPRPFPHRRPGATLLHATTRMTAIKHTPGRIGHRV